MKLVSLYRLLLRACTVKAPRLLFPAETCAACRRALNMQIRLNCALIVSLKAVYPTADGVYALIGVRAPYGSLFGGVYRNSSLHPRRATHRPYNSMRQPSQNALLNSSRWSPHLCAPSPASRNLSTPQCAAQTRATLAQGENSQTTDGTDN